jgi:ammonium transporter, Amt family
MTGQDDLWRQIGQAICLYFDVDAVGFLYRNESNHWQSHYWSLPPGCDEEMFFTPELQQTAAGVLESSFVAYKSVKLDSDYQLALLPVIVGNKRKAVMLIGYNTQQAFPMELSNIFLGVAGLAGETVTHAGAHDKMELAAEIGQKRNIRGNLPGTNLEKSAIIDSLQEVDVLRRIVENALEIIYTLTPDGMIAYASPRWTQLIGHEGPDLLGRSFVSFLHPADRAVFQSFFAAVAAGSCQNQRIELRIESPRGLWRWYSTTLSTVKDRHGDVQEFVGIAEDITDRKHAEEELRSAKEMAEAATVAKTEFLTNVSHEIRTPMTAILGFAEMLLESLERPEDVVAANTIKRNGEYLLNIINDILDLSKIESGHFVTELVKCSPRELIDDVIAMMKVRADAKGLPILLEYDGLIPQTVRTDPVRVRQILINLIGNAVKFTEEGHIQIKVEFIEGDQKQPLLQCKIIDTGIGMTEYQINRLFEPFNQADTATSRKYMGTGLGLALGKRLAGMLGGDITFSSAQGHGSTFIFTMNTGPLDGVRMMQIGNMFEDLSASTEDFAPSPTPQFSGRILLAEDGLDNQRLLALILRKAGLQVHIANNGKEALEKVTAEMNKNLGEGALNPPFDIILMDMQMPEVDGYEATWRLREMGYAAPIIALTAHAMDYDREKCLGAGCDEYLTKPIDRESLFSVIERYIPQQTEVQQEIQAWNI